MRNVPHELVHQPGKDGSDLLPLQRHNQQPDTARDVEPNTTGRDDAARFHIGCRDPSDRESVSPVDVRHRIARFDDARKRRHVDHLIEAAIGRGVREQGS